MAEDPIETKIKERRCTADVYSENPDISRKHLDEIIRKFDEFDLDKNGQLDLRELTLLFEKLKAPQTVTGLKQILKRVDEDGDNQVNLKEFIKIFRIAASENLDADSPLKQLASLTEIDVSAVGVKSAANFFEAQSRKHSNADDLAAQIEKERAERKQEQLRKQQAREKMAAIKNKFEQST